MKKAAINRRDFLRLCVITAGSAIAAACEKALTDATAVAVGTSTPAASPTPSVKLSLIGGNQDVWTWIKPVNIRASGECEDVTVYVNGGEFEARPEGEYFTADVRLSEGENQVSAACGQRDGGEIRSNMLE